MSYKLITKLSKFFEYKFDADTGSLFSKLLSPNIFTPFTSTISSGFVNSVFPGMDVRFTRNGSIPSPDDQLYLKEIKVLSSESIVLRSFDQTGRGGRHIVVNR